MMSIGRFRSKGVALITALLVTSIATLTAVSMASRQFVDVRRTGNMLEADQAYIYTLGIETVAIQLLSQYSSEYAYDDQALMYVPYTFPVEGGVVSGTLRDMEALFNINSLINLNDKPNKTQLDKFERLLTPVLEAMDEDTGRAKELSNAIVDWIDENEEVAFPGGAEDSTYLSLDIPYRAANRFMVSPSEMLLIEGFNREILYGKTIDEEKIPGLLQYVTALPQTMTEINVNSASVEVLLSLSKLLDRKMLEDMIASRPFKELSEFKQHEALDQLTKKDRAQLNKDLAQGLTVASSYLTVQASGQVGRANVQLSSLIYRTNGGGKIFAVSRTQGIGGL